MSEDDARGLQAFERLVVVPEGSLTLVAPSGERAETMGGLRARLRQSLAPDVELAPPLAARLSLARVAPELAEGDPWLGPIARRGGRAWLRVLDAMDDALGAVRGRRDALAVVARGNDGVAARAHLLENLARGVDRALASAGFVDPRRESELVADRVAHAEPSRVVLALSARDVRARGIVAWSPADLALFRVLDACLSRVGGRASVELPVFERPLDAERERDPLDKVIEAVASALDDAPLTTAITASLGDLTFGAGPFGGAAARIEIRQAMGAESQGRAVADAVEAALRQGAAPDDVLVVIVSDDETSARETLRALADAAVPAVDARRNRPRPSNLRAFADFALDVAARGAPRGDVAILLRSVYVDAPRISGLPDVVSAERSLRDLARVLEETSTAFTEEDDAGERLAATVRASRRAAREDVDGLARTAKRVGESLARVRSGTTRLQHVRNARALWDELGLALGTANRAALARPVAASPADFEDLAARARDDEASASLEATLTAYAEAVTRLGLGEAPAPTLAFRHELGWAQDRASPPARESAFAVRLVRFEDLPPAGAPFVVFVDADEDAWPDGRVRAELVSNALEERLDQATEPSLRAVTQASSAAVLARLALGTSRAHQVVFCYRVRDAEGGERGPAPVVGWLAPRASTSTWKSVVAVERPLSARDQRLAELIVAPERAARIAPEAARRARVEQLREDAFGRTLGDVHPLAETLPVGDAFRAAITLETGGAARPLSVSAIDRLAACVFRGFVTEVLRPRRSEETRDLASAREEGTLVHAGLEEAFRATTAFWSARPRDGETILREGLAAADRALDRAGAASELARVVVDQAREAVRAVLEWSIADVEWDFAHAERAFGNGGDGRDGPRGDESSWDSVILERGETRVALRGKIDRVDVAHGSNALRVIDYKTRERAAEEHTSAFGTTKFQLALYARAARGGLGLHEATGLYLATQRLVPGGAPKKHAEKWREAHREEAGVVRFESTVLGLVEGLRQGRVFVRPHSEASCVHCEYEGVCRKPRFAPASSEGERDEGGGDDAA